MNGCYCSIFAATPRLAPSVRLTSLLVVNGFAVVGEQSSRLAPAARLMPSGMVGERGSRLAPAARLMRRRMVDGYAVVSTFGAVSGCAVEEGC